MFVDTTVSLTCVLVKCAYLEVGGVLSSGGRALSATLLICVVMVLLRVVVLRKVLLFILLSHHLMQVCVVDSGLLRLLGALYRDSKQRHN